MLNNIETLLKRISSVGKGILNATKSK